MYVSLKLHTNIANISVMFFSLQLGQTALLHACIRKQWQVAHELIAKGANVNACDPNVRMPKNCMPCNMRTYLYVNTYVLTTVGLYFSPLPYH